MSNEALKKALLESNVPLLANAIELGAEAILDIAGNATSSVVDGQQVSRPYLHSAIGAKLQVILNQNINPEA